MDAVAAGDTFIVTRNGEPVAASGSTLSGSAATSMTPSTAGDDDLVLSVVPCTLGRNHD